MSNRKSFPKLRLVLIPLGVCAILVFCGRESPAPPVEAAAADLRAQTEFAGRIVFQSNFDGDNEIYLLTTDGLVKLTDNSWQDEYPVWSPDGRRLAYTANPDGRYHIYVMNADGSNPKRIIAADADDKEPAWWPDGESLVFTRETKKFMRTSIALYRVNLDGDRVRRLIAGRSKAHGIANVSPDGRLVTLTAKRTFGWDAAVYRISDRTLEFLDDGGKSCRGRFSPDGLRLAYVSSRADGKGDIWLMNPDGSDKSLLSFRVESHDYFPAFSPDGRFVVFNSSTQHDHGGDWRLMIVEVATGKVHPLLDSPGNDVFPDWR